MNFTPNFVGKLTTSFREKFPSIGEIVSEFPHTLWLGRLGSLISIFLKFKESKEPTQFKLSYADKNCQAIQKSL